MSKIIKYYADIGCVYNGECTIKDAYKDLKNWNIVDCGIIGILKLEIDPERRTKKEIYFRQILSPILDNLCKNVMFADMDQGDVFDLFRKCGDMDMLVTWNGRDFDIPIIMNNFSFYANKKEGYDYINGKDRDLLDIALLKNISVKGGLEQVVKRFKIQYDVIAKDIPTYNNDEVIFLDELDTCSNLFNNKIKITKDRNEFDVRILPLLEEKLGYLYEPRRIEDKFHKKWK